MIYDRASIVSNFVNLLLDKISKPYALVISAVEGDVSSYEAGRSAPAESTSMTAAARKAAGEKARISASRGNNRSYVTTVVSSLFRYLELRTTLQ